MPKVIVDSREARSGLTQMLAARGADVCVEELECGDYVLADGLAVERKAASDFVVSILDNRIFSQVPLLKATYKRPFVLIEGDVFATRSAISEESLLGALSYISVVEGIQILTSRSTTQTASMLLTMQRHALDGLGYEVPLRGGKPKDRTLQAQYLVEGLPGIGPGTAKKLLQHFGTPNAIFSASAEDLKTVPGVGPKTVTALREVLECSVRAAA